MVLKMFKPRPKRTLLNQTGYRKRYTLHNLPRYTLHNIYQRDIHSIIYPDVGSSSVTEPPIWQGLAHATPKFKNSS
jgi:hypothetical protein